MLKDTTLLRENLLNVDPTFGIAYSFQGKQNWSYLKFSRGKGFPIPILLQMCGIAPSALESIILPLKIRELYLNSFYLFPILYFVRPQKRFNLFRFEPHIFHIITF